MNQHSHLWSIILIYVKNVIVIIIACVIVIIIKKKVKNIFSSDEYNEFHKKIIKLYFNIWYIKFFYVLQKYIKLNKNIHNINVLINKFINLYHNSNIDCNKKNKNKLYDLYNIILNKFVQGNEYKNNAIFTIYYL